MNDSVKDDSNQEHQRLRRLILGKKQTQKLDDLRPEFERVSEVISEAIKERNKKDNSIGRALSPSLETALQDAIEKNPNSIIDTLFPIITPALRKAINSAMAEMLLSFNQVLEKGLSPKFISWRLQAWRSGKSFAEFILLKTIKYRVEQVILIDRRSSLVMALKTAPEVKNQDAEQVSAMLSAISDFVNESFNSNNQTGLETIRSGGFVLELASSPTAILVAAIRGVNSIQIKQQLGKTLEELHVQHHKQIQSFNGERLEDEHIDALLGDCLLEQRTQEEEEKPRKPWLAIFTILLVISTLGYYAYLQWYWSNQAESIIEHINREKGYLLTQHERTSNHLNLTLLRSPSSTDIEQIIEPIKNDLDITVQQSYAPIGDSSFFLPYIKKHLNLNSKHTLTSDGKHLSIQGILTQKQVQNIASQTLLGQLFEEVEVEKQAAKFNITPTNGVHIQYTLESPPKDTQEMAEIKLKRLIQELNQVQILFPFNTIKLELETNIALQKAVKLCKQIKAISDNKNQLFPDLIIMGFADNSTKNVVISRKVSLQRAKFIQNLLIDNGIPEAATMVTAMFNLNQSSLSYEQQRRVSFHATYIPLSPVGISK